MANKINEIIEVINGSESVEGLTTKVENIEDDIDITSLYPNQKINSVVINNANNIDAILQVMATEHDILFRYVENWTIVSNEDDIFETINGQKYFKHDTFLYFNYVGSRIREYFIKGFPKKKIRISHSYIGSTGDENLEFVIEHLSVTNDDRIMIRENTLVYNFNETPTRSQNDVETKYPEYGTSYDDTGDYGKILMFVRTVPPNN